MPRIRTIKPEFFKHEALFEAEIETGLPLRLAYIGLWTQCDREGRFLWRPRPLKLDVLPYDDVDFSRVLDALAARGFVVKYVSEGREIGWVPSFQRHQVINNRESTSSLPPPPENIEEFDASGTRGSRVEHAASGEGKGKEGKGTVEPNGSTLSEPPVSDASKPKAAKRSKQAYTPEFEAFWIAYPSTEGQSKLNGFKAWQKLSLEHQGQAIASLRSYADLLKRNPDRAVKHVQGYLNGRMFESFAAASTADDEPTWRRRLIYARDQRTWSTAKLGPLPGQPGCRVPPELLSPGDGVGWVEARAA
jgi:hypothetical protein